MDPPYGVLPYLQLPTDEDVEVRREGSDNARPFIWITDHDRVSLTYRVKSAHKLKLTDQQLLQWMFPILLVMLVYLGAWTVSSPPATEEITYDYGRTRFTQCAYNWWDHSLAIGSLLLLVWQHVHCVTRLTHLLLARWDPVPHLGYQSVLLGAQCRDSLQRDQAYLVGSLQHCSSQHYHGLHPVRQLSTI